MQYTFKILLNFLKINDKILNFFIRNTFTIVFHKYSRSLREDKGLIKC